MSKNCTRRKFPGHQKAGILKRHFLDKVPVPDLCEEQTLQPTLFYKWQKDLFDNAGEILDLKGRKRGLDSQQKKFKELEKRLEQKNEVIAELMQEHIQLKKVLGGI